MKLIELAYKLRPYIEKASMNLDDSDALEAVELFPIWKTDGEYATGNRVRYNGVLYRCLTTHRAQETWTPINASSLWTRVLIPDAAIVPEWEQPNSGNPYMTGDKVMFNGSVWESIADNNVWAPGIYGWKQV